MQKLSFDLRLLSDYRQILMGVAAIFILLCHASGNGVIMPSFLEKICGFGNIGVDMFLFLSGMGLYFSLSKRNEHKDSLLKWYLHRYKRIFVPYWLMVIPWIVTKLYITNGSFGLENSISSLFAYYYWISGNGAWFVSLIIILYIFAPLLHIICSCKNDYCNILVSLLLCFLGGAIRLFTVDIESLQIISRCFDRIPAFIVGVYMGKYVKEGRILNLPLFFLIIVLSVYIYRAFFPNCSIFWIYSVPLSIILCIVFKIIGKNYILEYMGTISLESYLANIFIGNILMGISWQVCFLEFDWGYGNYLEYFLVLTIGIIWADMSHTICKKII